MRKRQGKTNPRYTTDTPAHPSDGLPPRRAPGPVTLRRPTLTRLSVILPLTHPSTPDRVPRGTSARVPDNRDVNLLQGQTGHDAVRCLCLAVMDLRGKSYNGRRRNGRDVTTISPPPYPRHRVGRAGHVRPTLRVGRHAPNLGGATDYLAGFRRVIRCWDQRFRKEPHVLEDGFLGGPPPSRSRTMKWARVFVVYPCASSCSQGAAQPDASDMSGISPTTLSNHRSRQGRPP